MKSALRPHQVEAVEWLTQHPKGYLADAPRVGKTRPLLEAARRQGLSPLVVCPAIVRTHWMREAEAVGLRDIRVESYDMITRGGNGRMAQELLTHKRNALILDEAHYLKSVDAQRTRMLLGKDGYARRMEVVWPASGTPMPKHPGELFPVLASTFPKALMAIGVRSFEQFMDRFTIRVPRQVRGRWVDKVVGIKNDRELQDLLAPLMLRRKVDLPGLQWQVLRLDADEGVVKRGNEILRPLFGDVARHLEDLEAIKDSPDVVQARHALGDLKAPLVAAYVAELLENEPTLKVVLMAYHRSVLESLSGHLAKYGVSYIDGSTPMAKRDREIEKFQMPLGEFGATRVFVGQQIACQTGVRLDAADLCLLVEPDWTGVVNQQAGSRIVDAMRPDRPCVVQLVALAKTLDEGIVDQHHKELERIDRVLA